MYQLNYSSRFKKDLKRIKKQSAQNFLLLLNIVQLLEFGGISQITKKHKPHPLTGNYKYYFDIHVLPDLLLIFKEDKNNKIIYLTRAGSHSELF